jgi:predicted ester cyclase
MPNNSSANLHLVESLYATLMAQGDTIAAQRIVADHYVDHDIPGLGTGGRDELVAAVLAVRGAFPDIKPELFERLAQNDLVSVRVEAGGHHTGTPFLGVASSGRAMRWKEIHLFRCADGQIVEHWGVFDLLGIMQQLGVVSAQQ